MSKETYDPSVVVSRSVMITKFVNSTTGYLMAISVLFCMAMSTRLSIPPVALHSWMSSSKLGSVRASAEVTMYWRFGRPRLEPGLKGRLNGS